MTEQTTPFASMGYQQVPGLANRLIARYLRTQRKNMRRLFQERGLHKFVDRMNQIRNSRQGMRAKTGYSQQVLNEYLGLAGSHSHPRPLTVAEGPEAANS